ncbi:Nonsense-mediated mRNA decay protein 5, partial [Coemansia sp. RSA 2424]
MYNLDLNLGHGLRNATANDDDKSDPRLVDSDYESDSDVSDAGGDYSPWANLDRGLLQRIIAFLPRQSDRRSFCLVNREWALAGESALWAYPEFSTPKQLASFLRVVSDRPSVYGPHIRGIRFTLASHYDRHLVSPYYSDGDSYTETELPTLLEVAQGKHVLSADPVIMRSLLHGSDLTSPPLALRFARMCSPIDRLSIYGFRLRDKYIVNDLMRWSLRELEIVGMPRKPLANLSYLLRNLRSLRSLRIESDSPLPADTWGPLALRLPKLHKLRIWAPSISGSHFLRAMNQPPQSMAVLHLVGRNSDVSDEFVSRIVQGSPHIQSLVIHSASITASLAALVLGACACLTHLELVRDEPEPATTVADVPPVIAAKLATLNLQNLDIPDVLIRLIAPVVTGLRTLHIGGAPHLTGESVGALLCTSTRLAALGLFNCSNLSEYLLEGLVQGPSAKTLRVLMISQCAVQSDGVESVLSAFPNIKRLSIVGVEVVRQQYSYIYDGSSVSNDSEAEEPQHDSSDISVRRSFKPIYPSGHYFCKSDPSTVGCPNDEVVGGQAAADHTASDYQRAMWGSDGSAARFVPGLLAFANGAIDRGEPSVSGRSAGRRRATTISSEDHLDADESDVSSDSGRSVASQSVRRLRSSSEQPSSSIAPVAIYDEDSFNARYEQSRSLDGAMEAVPEHEEPVGSDEAELALEEVDRAIDGLEHEQLAFVEPTDEAAAEVVETVAEESAVADVIDTDADADDAVREVSAEPAVAEEAAEAPLEETYDREVTADVNASSSDLAGIAGGVALALAVAGASLAVFGSEAADEIPEPLVEDPVVEEPAAEAAARSVDEPASEVTTDEPAVETAVEETAVVAEELAAEIAADEIATEEPVAEAVAETAEVVADEAVAETAVEEAVVEVTEPTADEPAIAAEELVAETAADEVTAEEPVAEVAAEEPVSETVAEAVEIVADEAVAEPAAEIAETAVEETAIVSEEPVAEIAEEEPVAEAVETVADEAVAEPAEVVEAAVEEAAVEDEEPTADESTVVAEEPVSEAITEAAYPAAYEAAVAAEGSIAEAVETVADEAIEASAAADEEPTVEVSERALEMPAVEESVIEEPAA